ncbi:MAG: antitoxin Xre/MbcA/ParS toxin-binding domain-containing protein [Bacteroidota bacterium]
MTGTGDFKKNSLEEPELFFRPYNPLFNTNYNLVINAKKGVDVKIFYDILILTGLEKDRLASMFHLSMKTIMRYNQANKNLDTITGEQALKIVALFKKGYEVFGSLPVFRNWLTKPQYGLGRQIPFDLMETSLGIDLITEELIRIEYGTTA